MYAALKGGHVWKACLCAIFVILSLPKQQQWIPGRKLGWKQGEERDWSPCLKVSWLGCYLSKKGLANSRFDYGTQFNFLLSRRERVAHSDTICSFDFPESLEIKLQRSWCSALLLGRIAMKFAAKTCRAHIVNWTTTVELGEVTDSGTTKAKRWVKHWHHRKQLRKRINLASTKFVAHIIRCVN